MKCPGQDSRYWKPGAIFETECPNCGNPVEFFKDDTTRICKKCGHRFINPSMDFGCASYCKYAEQCLGDLPPELIAQRNDLLKDRVAVEVKRYFKKDFKRIGHAMRVARYAEEIGKQEGGNLAVILTSAYLHDIGIQEAERKHRGTDSGDHEKEGSPVAEEILTRLGAKEELIEEVRDIVGRHYHPGEEESINFRVLYDADMIANLEERHKDHPMDPEKLEGIIRESFLTESGANLARKTFLTSADRG